MNITQHRIALILGLAAAAMGAQAHAGQLSATRLIFANGSKDASITYTNTSDRCIGLYVWTADVSASDPATARSPIALLQPPKMVVAAGQSQSLRLRAFGVMPAATESMYWMSTHEVSVDEALCQRVAAEGNGSVAALAQAEAEVATAISGSLDVAVRTHIKVLVRPKGIQGAYPAVAKQVTWSLDSADGKTYVVASNPSAYHVHFSRLSVSSAGGDVAQGGARLGGTILPGTQTRFELERPIAAGSKVKATLISDQGGTQKEEWAL